MKTTINNKIALLITGSFAIISLMSCKKNTTVPDNQVTANNNGTVMLHFHTNVDTNEVEKYQETYVMTGGRKISVSLAQLYVSGIQLVKLDGSFYDLSGLNILKVMEVEKYLAGSIPAGNYKSIRFNVGLAQGINTLTPAANDSTLNQPTMWFAADLKQLGHVFVNFQGKIDTTSKGNGSEDQMQSFSYKIGTNTFLKNVIMPENNFSVIPGQTQFIHIAIDYSKLFKDVELSIPGNLIINSATDNTSETVKRIANNIPEMFEYEM